MKKEKKSSPWKFRYEKALLRLKKVKKEDEIEILEIYPGQKPKRKKHKVENRFALTLIGVFGILILIGTILFVTKTNFFTTVTQKILNGLGIYTTEVKNVELTSTNYNEPGSWHIDKSAKWIGYGKAQIIFDVNSVVKSDGKNKDIILVLDISGSMAGEKLEKAKGDFKELINYLLSDSYNRVALITFETGSTVISELSNDKNLLFEKVTSFNAGGNTNYNAALLNVDQIMAGYIKEENKDVVTLFLTDGYPCIDTSNQIGTYEILKDKYPYMIINGIQYEMGTTIIKEIEEITDNQWVADQLTLNKVLFEASISPIVYEEFSVTDYINNDYFTVSSVNDIRVSRGETLLTEEDGTQKITWNLGANSYMTSGNAKMWVDLTLKEEYKENAGYYPTNKKETATSKLPEETMKTINSTNTPVLKSSYQVIYDTNTPDGCTLEDLAREEHFVYSNVTKRQAKPTCDNYSFKGWELDEKDSKDIKEINDDIFIMPSHDVTIRGTWTKHNITKSMDGTVHEKTSLYKVLQTEAENGTYAKEYTGEHQDSMDASGKEKIYHWYAENDTTGTEILDKNNVIFAGNCWQMLRTTDTGGVKMIYNGEVEDGKCLNTRGTHIGYEKRTSHYLASNYWYGTDYTYDSTAKTFKVSGTTEQAIWNEETGSGLIGKYTCKLTDKEGTCPTLYLVESYYDNSRAYAIPLNSNSHYSQFGILPFNSKYKSPSYVGYMYNTIYPYNEKPPLTETMLLSSTLDTAYWYAHKAVWGTPITSRYNLVDAYKVSAITEYPNLLGEYTFRDSTENYTSSSVYYIAAVNNNEMYYIELQSGNNLDYYNDKYTYGDSYTDNKDGTYIINNPTTINRTEWYSNYSSMNNKYICKNATNNICSDLWYTTGTYDTYMDYIKVENVYKYAKGFTYDSNTGIYSLNNESVSFWNIADSTNKTSINNAHYTCWNTTGECTTLSYIYGIDGATPYYINLTNGKTAENALNEMFHSDDVNKINSIMKIGVEAWFKKYLLDYSDYLEDTIFCNDRSISKLGGWNPNGGSVTRFLQFKEYNSTIDLSCLNDTDKFSISNNKAELTYKVGLMSSPEINLLNNDSARKTGQDYWLISPNYFRHDNAHGSYVLENGSMDRNRIMGNSFGVRPSISLKPGTEYSSGDGSMASPYVVDLN